MSAEVTPEGGPGPVGPGTKPAAEPILRRLVREPLLHFVILGAALFVLWGILQRNGPRTPQQRTITFTLDDLRQLQIGFTAQWRRAPTDKEMLAMIEDRIREEILYREALAMGLDKDDTIVRRRMAQKMQFLAEDVSAQYEPTSEDLKAWFAKNTKMFEQPARVTFRTLYFSPDKRGHAARADAAAALARLNGKPATWPGAAALADSFMFPDYMADRTPSEIAKDFGPGFARDLFAQKPGAWSGPIESGYGWHLVFVDSLIPSRIPAFEEIEPDVKTAWLGTRKAEASEEAYKKMRSKYVLALPAPPEGAPTPGATQ